MVFVNQLRVGSIFEFESWAVIIFGKCEDGKANHERGSEKIPCHEVAINYDKETSDDKMTFGQNIFEEVEERQSIQLSLDYILFGKVIGDSG
jgi:hypothetical protein